MDVGYRLFCKRLLLRKEPMRSLLSGSLSERPIHYVLEDSTDVDILVWLSDFFAIPPGKTISSKFNPTVLTICTKDVYPGFVKLLTKSGTFFQKPVIDKEHVAGSGGMKVIPKGPSRKRCATRRLEKLNGCQVENIYRSLDAFRPLKFMEVDLVDAVYCPYWPPEVAEWATRKRFNGWPTDDVVKRIVQFGCHFVAKPHPKTPNDSTQWRFSFSNGELILIHGLNDVQKYIYHILRLIKKEVVKNCGGEDSTILCTYFFKTLMLWACEEKSKEFWTEESLENSIGELLLQLIEWLIERRIPNYFIPSYNMIDYLSDDVDLSQEIASLLYQKDIFLVSMLSTISKSYPGINLNISIPLKLVCYLQLRLFYSNLSNPLDMKLIGFAERFYNGNQFLPEMKYIYLAILAQSKSTNSQNGNRWRKLALKYFNKAIGHSYSEPLVLRTSSSKSVLEIFGELLSLNDITISDKNQVLAPNVALNQSEKVDFRYTAFCSVVETLLQNVDEAVPMPLYFIAAAYRANFLYTASNDYELAIKQCEEAIHLIQRQEDSPSDDSLVEFLLPFIIRSDFSGIFDKGVQTVFGFVVLCRNIFKKCNSFVGSKNVLDLDALQFLNYVRHQSLKELGKEVTKFRELPCGNILVDPFSLDSNINNFSNIFLSAVSDTNVK